jgi:hypothetical protein
MTGRVLAGSALLLVGLVIIGTVVVDLLGDGGTASIAGGSTPTPTVPEATPAPTVAESTAPTAEPTAAPTEAPSLAPTPMPTTEPTAQATAFYAVLVPAIRTADADTLSALLHPATVERYGEERCRAYLAGLDDPAFDVVVRAVQSPADWDYVTDDRSTTIPDAWTIEADLTSQGATQARELHLAPVDGELRWFTDCGEPLG